MRASLYETTYNMDDFRLQSQSARSKRWSVAFSAALMNLMQTGAFFFTPTTLMPLLVADFGLDLAVSTVPIAVGKIAYVVLLIPGGVLVDLYGPRRCVIGGLAGIAFFLSCYALFARSFTHVLIAHVALATASSVSGVPVYSLFIAQWFRDGVGLAMGLVLAGYSAAGATVPAILGPIATEYGWRAAMACTAVVLWVVAIPVAVAFLTENHDDDDDDGSGSETHDIRVDESELPHSPPGEATPLVQPRDAVQNNANIPDPPAEHTASVGDRTASPVLRSLTQNTPIERRKVDNKSWTFVGFALNYMLLQYAFGAFGENVRLPALFARAHEHVAAFVRSALLARDPFIATAWPLTTAFCVSSIYLMVRSRFASADPLLSGTSPPRASARHSLCTSRRPLLLTLHTMRPISDHMNAVSQPDRPSTAASRCRWRPCSSAASISRPSLRNWLADTLETATTASMLRARHPQLLLSVSRSCTGAVASRTTMSPASRPRHYR